MKKQAGNTGAIAQLQLSRLRREGHTVGMPQRKETQRGSNYLLGPSLHVSHLCNFLHYPGLRLELVYSFNSCYVYSTKLPHGKR